MKKLIMQNQPDDETCGPTSLHAIYQFYDHPITLQEVVSTVERAPNGGTLAPLLGLHALKHGFDVTLYVNNLMIFDPSWFGQDEVKKAFLINKLELQMKFKKGKRFTQASQAYLDFIAKGGLVKMATLDQALIQGYLEQGQPILTALSATYLYQSQRERYTKEGHAFYDDIRGEVCGHFVILSDFDPQTGAVIVADPHRENPISHDNYYQVSPQRLINAIMLGILTYDAQLMIITPKIENQG